MNRTKCLCLASFVFISSACSQTDEDKSHKTLVADIDAKNVSKKTQSQQSPLPLTRADMTMTISGTIEYKTFEGGFYALIADDGRHYTPRGLAAEFLRHGMKITLNGEVMEDMLTTTQFGKVFNVNEVLHYDEAMVKQHKSEPSKLGDL